MYQRTEDESLPFRHRVSVRTGHSHASASALIRVLSNPPAPKSVCSLEHAGVGIPTLQEFLISRDTNIRLIVKI